MYKRFAQYILVMGAFTALLSGCGNKELGEDELPTVIFKKKYYNEPTYCTVDAECRLYDCTSCGNVYFVDKIFEGEKDCNKENSNIVGCKCEENVCKRVRK